MKNNRCARCGFFFIPPDFLDFTPTLCSDCFSAKRNNNHKVNNDYSLNISGGKIEKEFCCVLVAILRYIQNANS